MSTGSMVRGVGITNSGPADVRFYLTPTGQAPFTEITLYPNESHDYDITSDLIYLIISTDSSNTDKYTLYKYSRYHLIYNEPEQKWEVASDR
jgi:hypothetical protein